MVFKLRWSWKDCSFHSSRAGKSMLNSDLWQQLSGAAPGGGVPVEGCSVRGSSGVDELDPLSAWEWRVALGVRCLLAPHMP